MKTTFSILFSIFLVAVVKGGTGTVASCISPEASQFDFWIGNWSLTYNDSIHAFNTITKEMDGCSIFEHFNDPSQNFRGSSWSVYNPASKKWQQTWVDNQGSYIVLEGTFENGRMTLLTAPKQSGGKTTQHRMIFYNISANNFDWNWEASQDEGKTWELKWKIHYERKK